MMARRRGDFPLVEMTTVRGSLLAASTVIGLDFKLPRLSNSRFHKPSAISLLSPAIVQQRRSSPSTKSCSAKKVVKKLLLLTLKSCTLPFHLYKIGSSAS